MTIVVIAIGAAIGGFIRFVVEYKFPPVGRTAFPVATFAVNVLGSFILGFIVTAPAPWHASLGVGLCGALTTFSGVSLQITRRLRAQDWQNALKYVALSLLFACLCAWAGMQLGQRVTW